MGSKSLSGRVGRKDVSCLHICASGFVVCLCLFVFCCCFFVVVFFCYFAGVLLPVTYNLSIFMCGRRVPVLPGLHLGHHRERAGPLGRQAARRRGQPQAGVQAPGKYYQIHKD